MIRASAPLAAAATTDDPQENIPYVADYTQAHDLNWLTRLLDTQMRIPGTQVRFGLDPLLGMLPVAGDVVSLAVSSYILWRAWRMGLPKRKLARMAWNLGLDALLGALPVVGDVFDLFYRANVKNLKLIRAYQETVKHQKVSPDRVKGAPLASLRG